MAGRPEFLEFPVGDDEHPAVLGALSWPGLVTAPDVVAIPGWTQTAWSYDPVAHHLAGAGRLVAVDLRGRGRSLGQPGPFGVRQHADDVVRVIDQLDSLPAVLVGHGLGALVALAVAERHPEHVRRLLLLDGGPPTGFEVARGDDLDAVVSRVLGPIVGDATTLWPDRVSFRAMWSRHPAFVDGISVDLERNLLADLVEVDGGFRLAVDPDAVLADGRDVFGDPDVAALLERCTMPTTIVRAGPGADGRFPPAIHPEAVARYPQHRWVEATDLNHITVLLGPDGASFVADTVRSMLVVD